MAIEKDIRITIMYSSVGKKREQRISETKRNETKRQKLLPFGLNCISVFSCAVHVRFWVGLVPLPPILSTYVQHNHKQARVLL